MDSRIDDVAKQYIEEMRRHGCSQHAEKHAKYILAQLIRWHERQGKTSFDPELLEKYIKTSESRLAKDQIGRNYSQLQVFTAKRLQEFAETGKVSTRRFLIGKTTLNKYYGSIAEQYLDEMTQTLKKRNHDSWTIKRFFAWLISHDISRIEDITVADIRQFIIDSTKIFSPKSIPNLRVGTRKFFAWAFEKGYTKSSFEGLFEFTVAIERKIIPAPPPEEVSRVLDSIDRSTVVGKRNYAIIMLGVVMGLRAGDVASLKFDDINWQAGEIRITQNKTGKPLALPLTADVGEAVSDYIMNARPQSESNHIFLRTIPPFKELSGGSAVIAIYSGYRKRLGLSTEGFHSLRRSLGKNLVTSGAPLTTVAQVLGHTTINNTQQYVALDVVHLKECALDFKGIEPRGCT
jgi:integrase